MPLLVFLFNIVHHIKSLRRCHALPIIQKCLNFTKIINCKLLLLFDVFGFLVHDIHDLLVLGGEILVHSCNWLSTIRCNRRSHILYLTSLSTGQPMKNLCLLLNTICTFLQVLFEFLQLFMLLLAKWLNIDSLTVASTKYVQLMISEGHVEHHAICVFTPIACLTQLSQAHFNSFPICMINFTIFNCFDY